MHFVIVHELLRNNISNNNVFNDFNIAYITTYSKSYLNYQLNTLLLAT